MSEEKSKLPRGERGNYYKRRTKQWLEKKGYVVGYLERYRRFLKGRSIKYIREDIFGADLVAMNKEEIIFINSIFNDKQRSAHVADHMKGFLKYPYPPFVQRWIVVWSFKVKEPEIIEIENDISS